MNIKKIHLAISICLFLLSYTVSAYAQKSQKPELVKLPFAFSQTNRVPMENTPVLFNSRLLMAANFRPSGGAVNVKPDDSYLNISNTDLTVKHYEDSSAI